MSSSTTAAKIPLTHCNNMNNIHNWHAWRALELQYVALSQSHFCWRDWACPWRRHIAPAWTKIDFSSQLEVHLNWYTGFSLIITLQLHLFRYSYVQAPASLKCAGLCRSECWCMCPCALIFALSWSETGSKKTFHQERSYYRNAIEASKATFTVDGMSKFHSCLPHLSQDIEMHFSLDMAQQVGCMQLNPANKLTRTCKSIGALSQQSTAIHNSPVQFTSLHPANVACAVKWFKGRYKYDVITGNLHVSLFNLIDETGKGADNISMLLEVHNLVEANLWHSSGRNKNRFVCNMQYLSWREMVGLSRKITVCFLIVGDT